MFFEAGFGLKKQAKVVLRDWASSVHLAAVCGDSCKLAVLSTRGKKVADVLSSCNTEMVDPNVAAH